MRKIFRYYRRMLITIIVVSALFWLIAIFQVLNGNVAGFEPFLYGYGFLLYSAFNWADMLVFPLLWIILALILLRIKDRHYFGIAYCGFWFIRSSGEVIYSLNQQFNKTIIPWRNLPANNFIIHAVGPYTHQKYWVLEQTLFQSLAVLSLLGLIYSGMRLLHAVIVEK